MLLVVDNGSVYTQSLLNCIKELNTDFACHTFEEITNLDLAQYHSIILSGRRKNNLEMNVVNSKLIKHAVREKKPLLGICYGGEILALTLGGTIKKMTESRYGMHEIDIIKDNLLCSEKIQVFESHSFKVAKLDSSFKQIAKSTSCEFEIFQMDNLNIFGTQFHPEMSQDGKNLLRKFTDIQ
ncbi:MAG: glutamine amidotransferase [Thaumarchaeota archaeon 13_1_40CM_38_12]|nr:MAG: glutamine amidotransferase [Thaumarchaeota archaeon 13_1_40CM_38_12]OLC94686.1 MAG: glutamine amidotransferase [Thaumarchaeota archaeon 13_1_40CM_3_38_6]OLD41266.1 MAG: glutamine amidotransferase [Thaumarchaeota archaeon 13_1_40CM_2_39_4]OLE39792.1 MAG: glutamine amidotransferase [Thaumarchaeota archaeon 13_1_20CM_2_38_5]TLY06872.1 MAG: glutamine amidotransferase [Nitrososphaerota archaeon]